MTATVKVSVTTRLRHMRSAKLLIRVASRLRWRRLAIWAADRVAADIRVADGPWQPIGHVVAIPTADGGIAAEFRWGGR